MGWDKKEETSAIYRGIRSRNNMFIRSILRWKTLFFFEHSNFLERLSCTRDKNEEPLVDHIPEVQAEQDVVFPHG